MTLTFLTRIKMDTIKELENKIQRAKIKEEIIKKQLKNDFFSLIKRVFENKSIKAIYWTQYTPYFNDGEECIFRVNELCCVVNKKFSEIEDRYRNFVGQPSGKNNLSQSVFFYHIETKGKNIELEIRDYFKISELKDIMSFASQEKDMETIFLMAQISQLMTSEYFERVLLDTIGNHSKVTITNGKNGMEVDIESYAHD